MDSRDYDAITRMERELDIPLSGRPAEFAAPSVVQGADGFDVDCPCGFTSVRWPTEEGAKRRADEHYWEHLTLQTTEEHSD